MRKILNLLRGRRARLENDLNRELRYHFDRRVEDLRAEGCSEAEARKQAAIEMGGIEQVQEDVRETWTLRWLDDAARDARYAGRSLDCLSTLEGVGSTSPRSIGGIHTSNTGKRNSRQRRRRRPGGHL